MSEGEAATPITTYLEDEALTVKAWSKALRDGVLLGQRCDHCNHATAAPKAACVRCGARDLSVLQLPTEGEVYSETTIAVPPAGFEGPYQVVVIELDEGARVLARVDHEVTIGEQVELVGSVEEGELPTPLFS
jgi:uncharacterized OB-fold protein